MLDVVEMCYTCLEMHKNELFKVSKMDFDENSFLYKLKNCVSQEIEETTLKQICSVCVKQLQISYRFKQMVLLSQEALNNHKNEIISGNYSGDSKVKPLNSNIFEPECLVIKPEVENITQPCRLDNSKNTVLNDEIASDSDGTAYLVDGLGDDIKTSSNLNSPHINDDDNNTITYIIEKYECTKCNLVIESGEVHSCTHFITDDSIEVKELENEQPKRRSKRKIKPHVEYQCFHCGLSYDKRWKLQKHITRAHNDIKKFVCTYCNKAFKQSYHLREHLTSHTGERNYTCAFCEKSFQRMSSMRRHVKTHEAPPGSKTKRTPFLCTVCGKRFPFSNGVQRHMRIHLGIKNHECSICNRKFNQSTHLHVHMRTHTGEKPYICHTCGEPFSLNASLQKHMSVHQNILGSKNEEF